MPTIFLDKYKFRFYSSDFHEPPHMHVIHDNRVAKIWLNPILVQYNRGYNSSELNRILKLVAHVTLHPIMYQRLTAKMHH